MEEALSFPELTTERLALTALTSADASAIFALFSDHSVVEYYDLEAFTELSQASRLIEMFQGRFREHAGIRLTGDGSLIGTCGFNRWQPAMKSALIGYDLLPQFQGKGYMTEAVHCTVQAAFSGLLACGEVNRIQADTVPGNHASEAVLRKVGFQLEGIRRQSGYWKNRFHDLKCFGLLRSEYAHRPLVRACEGAVVKPILA